MRCVNAVMRNRQFYVLSPYPDATGVSTELTTITSIEVSNRDVYEVEHDGAFRYRILLNPSYHFGGEFARVAFAPVHLVDRLIRPNHWMIDMSSALHTADSAQ